VTGRFRFLRTPRWIAGLVLVVAVVVTFVNLGFWQLRRLEQRRDHNALVEERMGVPSAPLESVVARGDPDDAAVWRRVEARGRYDATRQVLVRNRSLAGRPGYHVLTPLVLAGGDAVYVNRGWIPAQTDLDEPSTGEPPPAARVHVEGLLVPGETRGGIGPRDPDSGVLDALARADLARLQEQSPWPVLPVVLKLDRQAPPTSGDLPVALPDPELSERNHLSYAIQWFLFATIAGVGFPLLLRRHARDQAIGVPAEPAHSRPHPAARTGEPATRPR